MNQDVSRPLPPFLISGSDLMSQKFPEPDWVVKDLLRTGRTRISLLAGQPESGKSTLAKQLAVAVSQGATFLGRQTVRGSVLYWQTEEADGDLQDDFRTLGYDPLGRGDEEIISFKGSSLENNLKNLSVSLEAIPEIKLVIIETIDDLLKIEDIKENTKAREAFAKFENEVLTKHCHRVAFLGLHHLNKNGDTKRGQPANFGAKLLGATYLRGRTDAKWYVHPENPDDPDSRRMFFTKVRRGTDIPATYLDFDKSTGNATLGVTIAEERRQNAGETLLERENQVIKFFTNNPNSTEDDCLYVLGNRDLTRKAIKNLRINGHLTPSGKGAKGSPYRYSVVEPEVEVRAA